MRQIGIIGLGLFGRTLAKELADRGVQVLAMDRERNLVEEIKESVAHAVQLDATDEAALQAVGIKNMDVVVVCIGEDIEANLLTTILLKKLGIRRIWVRAISTLQGEILKAIEVDEVVNMEEEMGRITAAGLASARIARHIPLTRGHSIAEIEVPESFIGKAIRQIDPRNKFHVNIIAIKKPVPRITELGERLLDEEYEDVPSPDEPLEKGHKLLIAGSNEDIERFTSQ
ncbi:MAG: TrkA family potassium uptake protein [Verrucomicrobia bacterium]|nr:TrkA family potassium uptake protein [Verrucomicrobiota bacterium]